MSTNKTDAAIGGLLVLLGVFVLISARSFPARTHLYVNLVSLAMIFSATILTVKSLYAQRQIEGDKRHTISPDEPVVWWFVLANIVFVGAIYIVGFFGAAFLFLLGSPVLLGQKKVLITLLVSCILVSCLYVIFVIFLQVPLPKGVLFS